MSLLLNTLRVLVVVLVVMASWHHRPFARAEDQATQLGLQHGNLPIACVYAAAVSCGGIADVRPRRRGTPSSTF